MLDTSKVFGTLLHYFAPAATAQPWREGQSASLFPGEGAKKHLLFSFLLLPFFFTHVLSPSPCDRGGRLTGITRRGAPFIDAGVRRRQTTLTHLLRMYALASACAGALPRTSPLCLCISLPGV